MPVLEMVIAVGLLIVGIGLAWLAGRLLANTGTTTNTALVILPFAAYLLMSGVVTDFQGFGIAARFDALSKKPVGDLVKASDLTTLAVTDKLANDPNFLRDAFFQACRPYYILKEDLLPSFDSPDFETQALSAAMAVRASMLCGSFRAIIVLDRRNKVIGFFEPELFSEILRIPLQQYESGVDENEDSKFSQGKRLLNTELGLVLKQPIGRAQSADARNLFLHESTSVVDALKALQAADVSVAPVTNSAGEFRGIVTRQQLVETLLLAVAKATSSPQE